MIRTIEIAKEFSDYLVNRNERQGDGTKTGVEFRATFLKPLESDEWWNDDKETLVLDFDRVSTIGPSWANEVFAYYTDKHSVGEIRSKILLKNLSPIKKEIVDIEIESGYSSSIRA